MNFSLFNLIILIVSIGKNQQITSTSYSTKTKFHWRIYVICYEIFRIFNRVFSANVCGDVCTQHV